MELLTFRALTQSGLDKPLHALDEREMGRVAKTGADGDAVRQVETDGFLQIDDRQGQIVGALDGVTLGSGDLNASACLQEVKDSFAQWSASCANVSFQYQGASNGKQLTSLGYSTNGKNELAWIEDGQWVYGSYVLGLTAPYFSVPSGEMGNETSTRK